MKRKKNFTSERERKLWIWALVVFIAIYATLFLGGQLIDFMVERRIIEQSTFYLFLVLILAFIFSGLKNSGKRLPVFLCDKVASFQTHIISITTFFNYLKYFTI